MPRPRRQDHPGAIHHVINRGARRQDVFTDPGVYLMFLEVLALTAHRYELGILAYALMPNHWHLLVESRHGNLSEAMQFLKAEFARRLNARHDWDGPIWSGRFFNKVIEGTDYLQYLFFYLARNPVKARLCPNFEDADWTSHRYHAGLCAAPEWLQPSAERFFDGHEGYVDYIQACADGEITDPEGWDPEQLERPHPTGALPALPLLPEEQLDHAVSDVVEVLGPLTRLAERRPGPPGNLAGCVAAWWLIESTVATHVQAARRLGISAQALSKRAKRARRLRHGNRMVDLWMRALEARGRNTVAA